MNQTRKNIRIFLWILFIIILVILSIYAYKYIKKTFSLHPEVLQFSDKVTNIGEKEPVYCQP